MLKRKGMRATCHFWTQAVNELVPPLLPSTTIFSCLLLGKIVHFRYSLPIIIFVCMHLAQYIEPYWSDWWGCQWSETSPPPASQARDFRNPCNHCASQGRRVYSLLPPTSCPGQGRSPAREIGDIYQCLCEFNLTRRLQRHTPI